MIFYIQKSIISENNFKQKRNTFCQFPEELQTPTTCAQAPSAD